MAISTQTLGAGGPATPARPLAASRRRTRRRLLADRAAARLVAGGGVIIIASILAILVVIAGEVYPLFTKPTGSFLGRHAAGGVRAPAAGDSLGVEEYREVAYRITGDGAIEFVTLKEGPVPSPVPVPGLDGASITTVASAGNRGLLLGTSDGRTIPVEMRFDVAFRDGRRSVTPQPEFKEAALLDPARKRPIRRVAFASTGGGAVTIAQVGRRELLVETVVEKRALIGESRTERSVQALTAETEGEITALRLDGRAEDLFVGTSSGQVLRYDLRERETPKLLEAVGVSAAGAPVTALGFLIGDRTLVAGDEGGAVSTWQVIPRPVGGERRLTRVYRFQGHSGPVIAITASKRDKGFATADASGQVQVHYGTSGKTLLSLKAEEGVQLRAIDFAPKADGLLAVDAHGAISHWGVDNAHPEVTLRTVFGKVWYEGYSEPAYVWQSTGGTDDFEAKLSLTPLIYGTLKGTFYALLFAVPLALLAALYVSEFMHPNVKGYVKPVVEIMAALPSVVLGFLAGLWLAPMVERVVPGVFLMPLVLPSCILLALLGWRRLPVALRNRVKPGTEALLLVPVTVLGLWVAFALGGLVEAALLGGSYQTWLLSALGLTYDQRNSLVVGIAMGFAVIPIIFTIAEDSLANVPQHLRAGSLALGATRWQTALRIVLPTASPGIFSAIMIGFGRAVGETMIVLMATGNTPVMDWSIFNGFRALSANIAVELPEAPEGGTLFRVLFLAAFLLFCLTFVVNTAAELVRLRLRRKYRYL
ncbi:MAG: ABC transporter permease subunit [Candidatus Rokubacteria bacterium]|nr:ABC transporter permease subunit [Candidatus Rokubacteria bacterium]